MNARVLSLAAILVFSSPMFAVNVASTDASIASGSETGQPNIQAATGAISPTAQEQSTKKPAVPQPAHSGVKSNKKPAKPPEPGQPSGNSTKSASLQSICSLTTRQCVALTSGSGTPVSFPPVSLAGLEGDAPIYSPTDGSYTCTQPNLKFKAQLVIDGTSVVSHLGTITGFSVVPSGNHVYIYSTTQNPTAANLSQVENEIGVVAAASTGFSLELTIPHSSTLGDIGRALSAAAPTGLKVAVTGPDSVRVISDGSVTCGGIRQFVNDVRKFALHTSPDTPVASVFYLDPAATAGALGGTAIPLAQGGTSALGTAPAPAVGNAGSGNDVGSSSSGDGAGSTSTGSGSGKKKPTGSGSTPITAKAQVAGGTKTDTPDSGTDSGSAATSDATATSPADGTQQSAVDHSGKSTGTSVSIVPSAPKPPAAQNPFSVNGRDLYFSGGTLGDDAWITEKKRALALLDLPQPQVLVNAWVMQSSTTKASQSGQLSNLLHEVVNSYNDTIQRSLYYGWSELRTHSEQPDFFNEDFYNYITLRTVFDPRRNSAELSPAALVSGVAGMPSQSPFPEGAQGVCGNGKYCLGFSTLFKPTEPRLTDMLLTLIAAKDPAKEACSAIDTMEGFNSQSAGTCGQQAEQIASASDDKKHSVEKAMREELFLQSDGKWSLAGCQESDKLRLIERQKTNPGDQRLPLECFRIAMATLGRDVALKTVGSNPVGVPQVGLVRAALADFLFNYKLSQQYPHEFAPYDLTASAQALDSALSPFIHAFNEDLQAFQTFVRAEVIVGSSSLKVSGDKNTFLNDGIITVQTTSGDVAAVSTGTQSYMNVSKAPNISQLLSSVAGAASGGTASPLSGVLANLSGNEAQVLVGALAAYQTTTLNVGRQLNLVVKPRSLLGASAAEMDVQFNANQSTNSPNYWSPTGGAGTPADLSAVTKHDVTTHVRVDSIRLFDISSLTAVLNKGRDKFPVLPPFVEIPYVGTLLGIPLPPAREYHSSSAVLSAVIVPTATDIAYSLRFISDRVVVGKGDELVDSCVWPPTAGNSCTLRHATSLGDFAGEPVREFHRLKVHCIITGDGSPYPGGLNSGNPSESACKDLTFQDAFHDDTE